MKRVQLVVVMDVPDAENVDKWDVSSMLDDGSGDVIMQGWEVFDVSVEPECSCLLCSGGPVNDDPEPTCDICNVGQYHSEHMEWNGETGNHVVCEQSEMDGE